MSIPDPELRRQLDAFNTKYNETFDKNDPAAMAALFTEDAVIVSNGGPFEGQQAIKKYYTDNFAAFHYAKHVSVIDPSSPHPIDESTMWATGSWSLTIQAKGEDPIPLNGYWSTIYAREGDVWKEKMQTWNMSA
jgi:uncharacterized protein (TIGR02246 family)